METKDINKEEYQSDRNGIGSGKCGNFDKNFAVVALYPVVLMFATLSEIIPIALDCDVNPEKQKTKMP